MAEIVESNCRVVLDISVYEEKVACRQWTIDLLKDKTTLKYLFG
jgi:hypothetical protein